LKNLLAIFVFWGTILTVGNVWAEKISPLEKRIKIEAKYVNIKQSRLMAENLFDNLWKELCIKFGEGNLKFPQQVVFLNGAPGSGKGANTPSVMRSLEISNRPIEVSSLLTTPECESLKAQGQLISDDIVVAQVMYELLKKENYSEIIIDGFPRTVVHAQFLKCLIRKLDEIHDKISVNFKIVRFCVTQQTSVERQLLRGTMAVEQNKKADSKVVKIRPTDMSIEAALQRYQIYEDSANTCMTILQDDLPIYNIEAEGTLEEVRRQVYSTLLDQRKKRR
jgi:adenylate kinase